MDDVVDATSSDGVLDRSSLGESCGDPEPCHAVPPTVGLLDLPWEDILYNYVLQRLSLRDLFMMRQVSQECLRLITDYFAISHTVDLGQLHSGRMSETTFQVLTKSCSMLTTLIVPNSKWLTDALLLPVLDLNHGLTEVDFSGCTAVTSLSMDVLADRCQHLRKLHLSDCYWLMPATLMILALNCSCLNLIDLTSCWQINDESVCLLVKRCPKLNHISLAKIYGITDTSLAAVSYHCRNLCHLDLVGCWRVSDDGIKMITEYCRDLKTLKVRECRYVSEVSLGALRGRVNVDLPIIPYPFNRAIFLRELGLHVQI